MLAGPTVTISAPSASVARALDGGRVLGHDDDGLGAERAGGVGDALGVVAGGVGDDAAAEGLGVTLLEGGDLVVGAAKLERADGLGGFVFQEDLGGVRAKVEAGVVDVLRVERDERGADGYAGDAVAGGEDVGEGDEVHGILFAGYRSVSSTRFLREEGAREAEGPASRGCDDFAETMLAHLGRARRGARLNMNLLPNGARSLRTLRGLPGLGGQRKAKKRKRPKRIHFGNGVETRSAC